MLSIPRGIRIYVALEPADMRKGIDGLGALVRHCGEDVFSGHLLVFISRRRDRLKILTWDTVMFELYYREQGEEDYSERAAEMVAMYRMTDEVEQHYRAKAAREYRQAQTRRDLRKREQHAIGLHVA